MEEKNNKNNSKINRRDFFKLAGVGTFASAAALYGCSGKNNRSDSESAALGEIPTDKMVYRTNPTTGDRVSLLGYGCMRWPTRKRADGNGDEIDQEAVNELIDYARALAAFEGGFRGIGLAVLVKQFDVVELIREVVPQPLPVVDGKVFGVFRRRADLDADDGIFDPFGLLQRQPHRIPYTRGIQTGRQQIVPHVEDAFGMFLVPRFSRDVPDVIYPVGDGFRFPYHGSSSLSSPFLVPSGRRLENRTLSSTSVTRSASLPSSLSHSSMKG